VQAITSCLADSLPREALLKLEERLRMRPEAACTVERRRQIETWVDAGMGCCALGHPPVARVVEGALLRFEGDRYRFLAWCIMPNHGQVLVRLAVPLGERVKSWKSYSGS
jgi:hypothetical protein